MKVGDKIKIIKNRYEVLKVGMKGEIYKIESENGSILYGVPFNISSNNILYWFYEDEIEKIGD